MFDSYSWKKPQDDPVEEDFECYASAKLLAYVDEYHIYCTTDIFAQYFYVYTVCLHYRQMM